MFLLPRAGLGWWSSCLCLLSSWDYNHAPAQVVLILFSFCIFHIVIFYVFVCLWMLKSTLLSEFWTSLFVFLATYDFWKFFTQFWFHFLFGFFTSWCAKIKCQQKSLWGSELLDSFVCFFLSYRIINFMFLQSLECHFSHPCGCGYSSGTPWILVAASCMVYKNKEGQ
jgi:hypothetical protein